MNLNSESEQAISNNKFTCQPSPSARGGGGGCKGRSAITTPKSPLCSPSHCPKCITVMTRKDINCRFYSLCLIIICNRATVILLCLQYCQTAVLTQQYAVTQSIGLSPSQLDCHTASRTVTQSRLFLCLLSDRSDCHTLVPEQPEITVF